MATIERQGLLRYSQTFTLSSRAKAFAGKVDEAALNSVTAMGRRALTLAKRNVAPGKGPGPHPHRQWKGVPDYVDTGTLMRSLQLRINERGFLKTATIFTDIPYGAYLEVGWHSAMSGRFYRYPWLEPAFREAQKLFPSTVSGKVKEMFKTRLGEIVDDNALKRFTSEMAGLEDRRTQRDLMEVDENARIRAYGGDPDFYDRMYGDAARQPSRSERAKSRMTGPPKTKDERRLVAELRARRQGRKLTDDVGRVQERTERINRTRRSGDAPDAPSNMRALPAPRSSMENVNVPDVGGDDERVDLEALRRRFGTAEPENPRQSGRPESAPPSQADVDRERNRRDAQFREWARQSEAERARKKKPE